jgi:hypothetical protein
MNRRNFRAFAAAYTDAILKGLEGLENLRHEHDCDYEDTDVEQVLKAIRAKVDEVERAFRRGGSA